MMQYAVFKLMRQLMKHYFIRDFEERRSVNGIKRKEGSWLTWKNSSQIPFILEYGETTLCLQIR